MKRHFMGESVHKVDQKGRVSVPVQFRRKLEADDPDFDRADNPTPAVVLIYGLHGGVCLEGYSMETFGELNESIARQGRFSAERTQLERIVNTKAYFTQVDESGRIVLPQRLREQIGVTDEAYFAGMGARFQIWSPAGYAAEEARMAESLAEPGREQSLLGLLDGAPS